MTTTTLTEKAIAVTGLPEGATLLAVNGTGNCLSYSLNGIPQFIDLPEGNWSILGRAAELTEAQKSEYEPLLKAKGLHVTNPYTNVECPNQWCENGYIDQGFNERWRCEYCQENEELEEEAELLTNPLILINE